MASCYKAQWRDYPETPEWQALPKGFYTGDEATARTKGATYRPDIISGAGILEVKKDKTTFPFVIIFR